MFRKADFILGFVALMWGTTFVIVKDALGGISTSYFLAVRFALATFCMAVLFFKPLRGAGWRVTWRGLRGGFAAGVFLWLGYLLQTLGLKYTSAGNSGFLTGLYVVLVPLISAAIYLRWPKRLELVGVAIAGTGMVLLTLPSARGLNLNRGDVLTVGCAVAFAFHLLTLGYFSKRERFEAVAVGQILCTAVLAAASLVFEPPVAHWTVSLVVAVVVTGICATALAFALQTWAQQFTSATRTAVIFALEPVFAFITAVLFGGEHLTVAAVFGGGLILGGILTVELG